MQSTYSLTPILPVHMSLIISFQGDIIEARFRGRETWYQGKISTQTNAYGIYGVQYDDGESEQVFEDLIRKYIPPPRVGPEIFPVEFAKGEKVEVRYRGRERYYPAKIAAVELSRSTYDVNYDDGEKEYSVSVDLIRHKGGSPIKPSRSDPTAGMQGKSKENISL